MDFVVISNILNDVAQEGSKNPELNGNPLPYGRQARQTLCYATPHLSCATQLVFSYVAYFYLFL
jgi:hypothetical protein